MDFSEYEAELFGKRPIIPNGWSKTHLTDKQTNFAEMNVSKQTIDQFFEENMPKPEEVEEVKEEEEVKEDDDISFDEFIKVMKNEFHSQGLQCMHYYEQNLLKGNIIKSGDENLPSIYQ